MSDIASYNDVMDAMEKKPSSPDAQALLVSMGKAIQDVSQRALRVARIVDRLEPGTYTIAMQKDTDGRMLKISISRLDTPMIWDL
jgi:hypothetical protein